MHSGTTMLSQILFKSSEVYAPLGETRFFERFQVLSKIYKNLNNDETLRDYLIFLSKILKRGDENNYDPAFLQPFEIDILFEKAKQNRSHVYLFRLVFDFYKNREQRKRWAEKTPAHVFYVEQMAAAVPDALFIEIVRDPRDILASIKTRVARRTHQNYDPFWDSLSWKASIQAVRQAKEKLPERILTVRYEDLVSAPKERVQNVCGFLGLKYSDEMLNISTGSQAYAQPERKSPGIFSDSVGRWETVLRPAETVICLWVAKTEMVFYDYAGARHASPLPMIEKIYIPFYLIRSLCDFFARFFRKSKQAGLKYALRITRNYFKRFISIRFPPSEK